MCAKWNNEIDHSVVIKAIAAVATVNKDGKASFNPVVDRYIATLASGMDFHKDIPQYTRQTIIWRAVCDSVTHGKLNAENIIRIAGEKESEHLRQRKAEYVLLTSVSVKLPSDRLAVRLGENILSFTQRYPRRFDRSKHTPQIEYTITGDLPREYAWVTVPASGRTWREAGDAAIEAVDLLRGIWNLCLTFQGWQVSSHARGPMNEIVLGPVHTVHTPNGQPAVEEFYYEPEYRKPHKVHDLSKGYDKLRKFQRSVMRQVNRSNAGALLRRSLIRYARTQDELDLDDCFLNLWSLLEALTCTARAAYDTTVHRAASVWRDPTYPVQELTHLRSWRNRSVHLSESSDDRETRAYQLKSYVDQMLAFLIFNRNSRRQSLEETMQLLDMPHDGEELKRKLNLYRKALRLHAARP